MAIAGDAFISYGIVSLVLTVVWSGFELGVSTLDGMTRAELNQTELYRLGHLYVATAAVIIRRGSP